METRSEEFLALMQGVREGSQEAAKELYRRYGRHIVRVVRSRLSRKLRSKFDSSDFAQAVWASFFAVPPDLKQADRPQALAAYLARMAHNKVIDAVRQRLASAKYDVERESSLDDLSQRDAEGLVAPEPTPSQVAMAREEWDQFLNRMPVLHRKILILVREQRTQQEIADKLSLDRGTVRRLLRRLAPEYCYRHESAPGDPVRLAGSDRPSQ